MRKYFTFELTNSSERFYFVKGSKYLEEELNHEWVNEHIIDSILSSLGLEEIDDDFEIEIYEDLISGYMSYSMYNDIIDFLEDNNFFISVNKEEDIRTRLSEGRYRLDGKLVINFIAKIRFMEEEK